VQKIIYFEVRSFKAYSSYCKTDMRYGNMEMRPLQENYRRINLMHFTQKMEPEHHWASRRLYNFVLKTDACFCTNITI